MSIKIVTKHGDRIEKKRYHGGWLCNKDITVNFIPAGEGPTDFYVQGADPNTGNLLNYQIDEGISGLIKRCKPPQCVDCPEASELITCYSCIIGSPVGQQFPGPDCPQGWLTDETAC